MRIYLIPTKAQQQQIGYALTRKCVMKRDEVSLRVLLHLVKEIKRGERMQQHLRSDNDCLRIPLIYERAERKCVRLNDGNQ